MAVGFIEILLAVMTFLGGSLGLPLGLPPGEEDPRMSRVAPENCVFYASWSGVDEIQEDRNPTEKWMAQPGVRHFLEKLRSSFPEYITRRSSKLPSEADRIAMETLGTLASTSFRRPASIYISDFRIGDDQLPAFEGAALIQLDPAAQQALAKWTADWNQAIVDTPQADSRHHVEMVDGIRAFRIRKLAGFGEVWLRIDGDLACLATSLPQLQQASRNLESPPPEWLQVLRKTLPMQRVASVGYLDLQAITEVLPKEGPLGRIFDPWGLGLGNFIDLKVQIGTVSGLDEKGFLTRTEIHTPEKLTGLWSLLDCEPLPIEYLDNLPDNALFAFGTRIGTDRIVALLKDMARQANQQQALDEALGKLESFTGVALEDELMGCLGDFVSGHFDFDINQLRPGLTLSIQIEDDMVFPGIFEQINQALEKSITDSFGPEAFATMTIGENTYYKFRIQGARMPGQQAFVWGIVDDRLVACLDEAMLQSEITGFVDGKRLSDQKNIQGLFEFGKQEGLENPVLVTQFDLGGLFRQLTPIIEMLRRGNGEIIQDLDFDWKDFPPPAEWYQDVEPNVLGIYRTRRGFQICQRQTYPGASPMVTVGGLIYGWLAEAMVW